MAQGCHFPFNTFKSRERILSSFKKGIFEVIILDSIIFKYESILVMVLKLTFLARI